MTTKTNLQYDAVQWLDAAGAALRRSDWADVLQVDGVDVFDALQTPLLLEVLRCLRESSETAPTPNAVIRAWRRIRLRAYLTRLDLQSARAARSSALPSPATVLFWPQALTHIKQQQPIANALRTQGISTGFLLNRAHEFESLREREPNTAFDRRVWPKELAEAQCKAAAALKRLNSMPEVALPSLHADVSNQFAAGIIRSTVVANLESVYLAAAGARAAVRDLKPDVIVVGNDVTHEGRVHCKIAKSCGVLTVSPMHGVIGGEPLQGRHVADAVFAYGERSRRDMIALGENPERIHVCGAAHLSTRSRQSSIVHPRIRECLKLGPNAKWVLLATSGPGHSVSVAHHCRVITAVARLSAEIPDIRFVAKLHPKDRLEYYQAVKKVVPNSRLLVVSDKTSDVRLEFTEWLQGCDAMITGGSAAGLDALLLNVPVVSVDLAGELEDIDFIQAGASLHAGTESELRRAVERVLFDSETLAALKTRSQEFLQEAFHAWNEDPARVAADTILRLRQARRT